MCNIIYIVYKNDQGFFLGLQFTLITFEIFDETLCIKKNNFNDVISSIYCTYIKC